MMTSFVPGAVGDSQPILKANAKSGRFTVDDASVTRIQFIADLENAEAGWMRFGENMSPDFRLVKVADLLAGSTPYPPPPDVRDKDGKLLYRRGFRLMVKIGDKLAGGRPSVRDLASNSFVMTTAIDDLVRAWYLQRQPGKLPVVEVSEWEEVKGAHGSNFKPIFLIKKLVDRPADLDGSTASASSSTDDDAPPAHVADVAGEPEDFDDFGEAA